MILPEPNVVVHANGRVDVQIFELVLPYDSQEHEEWNKASCSVGTRTNDRDHKGIPCIPANATTMNRLLKDVDLGGPTILNKGRGTFYHQAKDRFHYSEIKLARHLVIECGFSAADLWYENWRISSSSKALCEGAEGLQTIGATQVQRCLGIAFLEEMSALIERNKDAPIASLFPKNPSVAHRQCSLHDAHIDIFGYSDKLAKCAILEAKRNGERFAWHQAILLAFAAFLVADRRTELALPPDLTFDIGFVRFSSSQREHRPCCVSFETA